MIGQGSEGTVPSGIRILVIVVSCFSVAGCGVAARVDARNEYQASAANY
jgi:hypothetical protein